MTVLRRSLLVIPVGLLVTGIAATSTAGQLAPPFGSTSFNRTCGLDATNSSGCTLGGSASTTTGAVAANASLVSPADGTVPWSADASSYSFAAAPVYHLKAPQGHLDFTVTIHVNQADLQLRNLPVDANSPLVNGILGSLVNPNMNHWVEVDVLASASHATCVTCAAGDDLMVLRSQSPASLSASGRDYVLQMSMSNANGGPVPAGDITVRAGVGTAMWQAEGPGNDTAAIDAVVTGISVN